MTNDNPTRAMFRESAERYEDQITELYGLLDSADNGYPVVISARQLAAIDAAISQLENAKVECERAAEACK